MSKKLLTSSDIETIYGLPFLELLYKAQQIHRQHFEANEIELCTLLSLKTGTCPEDCAYCPQSAHYQTGLAKEKLLDLDAVLASAKAAKEAGAYRFCMGGAWRNPPARDFPKLLQMVGEVKALGLETCLTVGMLTKDQASALKEAGLDFYNHNLDTSPDYYAKIITTRTYEDRLNTLANVRDADIKVCCGGILGMGESRADRIELLKQLANLPTYPESVPINRLVPIPGTPLAAEMKLDNFEFIRTVAVARIIMPKARIRLSAGRDTMSEELQTLCFMAGANSIFFGDKYLTAPNCEPDSDKLFMDKLGLKQRTANEHYAD